jgi:NAD(P)H-flavin reductase
VVPVLEEPPEGWTGEVGRMDATLLARHLPEDHRARQNLACGPVPMIEAVARGLGDVGVPMSRCNTELFDLV